MPISILSSKGRVTIPREIRVHLNLKPGDKVEFVIQGEGKVRLFAKNRDVRELRGMLGPVRKRLTIRQMDDGIRRAVARDFVLGSGQDKK
jgi:AbrB family looped-hinge helix DNA binding protein